MIRKILSHFKQNFLTGVFVIIPIAIVVWLTKWILSLIWQFHDSLPTDIQILSSESAPDYAIDALLGVLVILILAFLIASLGWISKQYVGQKVLQLLKKLLEKIPFLGTVYSALDQLFRTLGAGGQKQFSRVVQIEYPRKGIWVIGFVAGEVQGERFPKGHVNVFIPTVPNPTSGFHLMVPAEDTRETGLTVEEAFRIILSLGIAQSSTNDKK